MSTLIGYTIGILFVIGLVGGPAVGNYFFSRNIYYAFVDAKSVEGEVYDCHVLKSRSGSTINRSWAPVAKDNEGNIAKGSFGWKKKKKCTDMFGDKVTMTVSSVSKDRNQINTFFQLWFMPLIMNGVCLVLYGAMIKGFLKKRRNKKRKRRKS